MCQNQLSIKGSEAHADVGCKDRIGFQRAFFDIKVSDIFALSYREKSITTTLPVLEKTRIQPQNDGQIETIYVMVPPEKVIFLVKASRDFCEIEL